MIVSGEMDGLWVLIADWNAGALDQIPSATQRQEDKTQTNTDIGDQLNRTHCLTLPDMWFAILHGSCALTTCPTSFTTTICPVAPVPYETDCFLPCVIICVCEFWCETSACVPTLYSLFVTTCLLNSAFHQRSKSLNTEIILSPALRLKAQPDPKSFVQFVWS